MHDHGHWRSLGIAALLLVAHVWFANEFAAFPNPNVRSRAYLTLAIVDHGELQIDNCVRDYGPTMDMARIGDRLYSDKAPGASVLLVPIAWVARRLGVSDIRDMCMVLRLIGVSLPVVAFWLWTRRRFAELAGDTRTADAIVLAGALGTNFFIYATQLFSHAVAGMLLYVSARCLVRRETGMRMAIAGAALLAAAFTCDYIVMPAVVVLAIAALAAARPPGARWRVLVGMVIGAAPIAVGWMAYNQACFGHPLDTGFRHHVDPIYGAAYQSGWWGVQLPTWQALVGMLVLPSRGVLFISPFLALAIAGWWRAWHDPTWRLTAGCGAAAVAGMWLFTSMMVDWKGGWSVGVRYLVPAVPFMLEGVALALRAPVRPVARGVFVVGIVLGMVSIGLTAMTFPDCPDVFWNPPYDMALPLLMGEHVNETLIANRLGVIRIIPFVVVVALGIWLCLRNAPVDERESTGQTTSAVDRKPRRHRVVIVAVVLIGAQCTMPWWLSYARALELAGVIEKMGHDCAADRARITLHERHIGATTGHPYDLIELAWVRVASACAALRDGPAAAALIDRAERQLGEGPSSLAARAMDARAAWLAAAGDYSAAASLARTALSLLPAGDARRPAWAARLALYEQGRPFVRASSDDTR